MAVWTDSFTRTATVATTSKTQVGTDINVPGGETWTIIHLIGGHPQGGSMGYGIDKIPGINASFPQSTAAAMTALEALAPGSQNAINTVVSGPAALSVHVVNAAATSGTARLWIKVIRQTSGQQ